MTEWSDEEAAGRPAEGEDARDDAGRRPPVDRSLRLRVWIYLAIFVGAFAVVVVETVVAGTAALLPVAVTLVIAVIAGVVASRVTALRWDITSRTVVGGIDAIGAVVLVGYVLLLVFRERLITVWVAAPVAGSPAWPPWPA